MENMVASVWRRTWRSRVSSTTTQRKQEGGGGGLLQPATATCGRSTTSDSTGELRPRDFHPFMALPTAEEELDLDVAKEMEDDRVRKVEHIKGIVLEFSGGNHVSAMGRWLSDLDVGWVPRLAEIDESAIWRQFQYFADSCWILDLHMISESISISFDGWWIKDPDEELPPSISEFIQLVEAAVLKMLTFVDTILAAAATIKTNDRSGATTAAEKLKVLIEVNDALSSMALEHMLPSSAFGELTEQGTMRDLLSADLAKLDEAIWGTIVDIRNNILTWMDKDAAKPYAISDIHKITRSVTSCANVLLANRGSVNRILHDAVLRGEYVPDDKDVSHLSNLIMKMTRSLEEKLTSKSWSWFPDQGLRFLFLINNSDFILQNLLDFPVPTLSLKVDDYINSYLQVSWAPVLKCLHDPAAPRCFIRYSPLTKFKSKFLKTYTVQKLWKVPDPDMRKRIRKAITDKVLPVFAQFLEHNSIISTPGVITPRKVEMILGELFEG